MIDVYIISNGLDHLRQGGWVLWPLAGVSVWMWYLIIKKMAALYNFQKQRQTESGASSSPFQTVREHFSRLKTDDDKWNKRLLYSLVHRQRSELERHVQTIFVLASLAPLLGLLGTVSGMISTFNAISQFGTANARAMAAGISEALITTQIGLMAAVPGLLMGNFIRRRTDALQMRLDRYLKTLQNRFEETEK